MGATVVDFGLLTTPQLHFIVREYNLGRNTWASEAGYYTRMSTAFRNLTKGTTFTAESRGVLVADGACGIGAVQFPKVAALLTDLLKVEVRQRPEDGVLNHLCGAEHAQKSRTPPQGFDAAGMLMPPAHGIPLPPCSLVTTASWCSDSPAPLLINVCVSMWRAAAADKNLRCCSFDGDADRLVYHYFDDAGTWRLLDGDAIACLCGVFFADQLASAGLTVDVSKADQPNFVKLGLVQTAYANGASTNYIKDELHLPVPVAKTGVRGPSCVGVCPSAVSPPCRGDIACSTRCPCADTTGQVRAP